MSTCSVEAFLHAVAASKRMRTAYAENPVAVLEHSSLSADEQRCVLELDLGALLGMGVNPMMLQGFWVATRGRADFGEFVSRINALEAGNG